MYRFWFSLVLLLGLMAGGCRGPRYDNHDVSNVPPPGYAPWDPSTLPTNVSVAGSLASPAKAPSPHPAALNPPVKTEARQQANERPVATATAPGTARVPATEQSVDPADTWLSVKRWSETQRLGPLQQVGYSEDPVFELATPRGPFLFQIHSRQTTWKGMQLFLGFAPTLLGNEPCLHELDLRRTLEPLLLRDTWRPDRAGVIVLDPGHGGGESGTRSVRDGSREKTYTLDWALRLEPLLKEQGWTVLLTRTNDTAVALAERVAFAERAQADLFLSLHFNASGNGHHQVGLETYCLTPTGMPSTLKREFNDDASELLGNNAHDAENIRLAAALHHALLEANGGLDRGVRRARFMTVLRGQNRPAVLIEGGYLSNPEEAARIADPQFRQQLAEAVARVLRPDPHGLTGAGGPPRSAATP